MAHKNKRIGVSGAFRSARKKVGASAHRKKRNISVYSNLVNNHRSKREIRARKRAEYLATLPKHPLKRIIYVLNPKRVAKFWFSKEGLKLALKIIGVFILLLVLLIGALFAYYRKDLDAIRPGEIDKRVQTTVTRYLDRNGKTLWEDKGTGNYTLVVKSDQINTTMKQATVAIEDKDFYNHGGVSFTGTFRAALSNAQGNVAQGGSTLTQQLVKQVFFPPDQAQERGLAGIPRKIKEMILSIEVERMYNKDQILTLYLNESPYGGRRNGVESAAQTYFGKSAKDLTLAESALLAAIPNNPSVYNPYLADGHDALITRQQKVLDNMVEMKYITQAQADEAKKVPILDTLKAQTAQYDDIKAPHFVLMVKDQLEQQLGKSVVGNGGLTVTTTLDLDVQTKLEDSMNQMFNGKLGFQECGGNCPAYAGFENGAAAVEDTQTGQLIALMGSKDYKAEGFGENNAAVSYIPPGSSIKPLVYAQLFQKQPDGKPNWGAGSILPDNSTNFNGYKPNNADGGFKGNISIRTALDLSRNIPAIKAMQVAGVPETWKTIRDLGDTGYCTNGTETDAGLSSAIGSCGTRLIDHVNAMASLGRLGAYLPQTTILEVKSSSGETLKKYSNAQPTQVVDPQSAYIVNDILADTKVRAGLLGTNSLANMNGKNIKVSVKTGTTDVSINGKPYSKDLWAIAYTPSLSMSVWLGNTDNKPLTVGRGNSRIPMYVVDQVMAGTTDLYSQQKKLADPYWKRPTGIQVINGDLYPSYFNKASIPANTPIVFDKVSKKKATACTPELAKETINVLKSTDPVTKQDIISAPDGYDANAEDNSHLCTDSKPTATVVVTGANATVTYGAGTFAPTSIELRIDGQAITSKPISTGGTWSVPLSASAGPHSVTAVITDSGYYQTTSAAVPYTAT